jgi:fucose 4-O-acetylase-like acetyltransferase
MTEISEESAPRAKEPNRLALYDALKCLAAFGVIMFHAGVAHKDVWLSGMFLFLFFLGYHAATGRASYVYVNGRFRRLVIPWIFWCAVYWALYAVRGEAWMPFDPIEWSRIFVGTNVHLWFLPFAFGTCILLACVNHLWAWTPVRVFGVLVMVFVLCGAMLFVFDPEVPISQWLFSLPVCWLGFLAAQLKGGGTKTVTALMVLGLAIACIAFALWEMPGALQTAIAVPFCWLALFVKVPNSEWLAFVGLRTMGIYLIHPAVNAALFLVVPGLSHSPDLVIGMSIFVVSLILVSLMWRLPVLRSVA